MHFDLAQMPTADVPRPIALATTVDGEGRVNAASFSFFNAVSSVPSVVVLGISPGDASGDGYKDTERNIRDNGEFVVNLVDEELAEQMNICAVDFPAGTGELDKAQLTARPRSARVCRGSRNRRSASNVTASAACCSGRAPRSKRGQPTSSDGPPQPRYLGG